MPDTVPAVAITAPRVFLGDESPPREDLAVLVSGGAVTSVIPAASVPGGMRRVDFENATLLPGLINLHSHMYGRTGELVEKVLRAGQKAAADLRSGITTSRDLGAPDGLDVQLRDLIRAGVVPGPDLIVAARPITRTGGHNFVFSRQADGPDEVRKAVREQLRTGADCIKLMASEGWSHAAPHRPGLSVEEMSAAVDEAHRLGLRVTVHAQGPEATSNALRAGVDCVEHAVDGITDEIVQQFLDTGINLDTTASSAWVFAHSAPTPANARRIEAAKRQVESEAVGLAKCVAAGVRITGATDGFGTMPVQYRLLLEAGMSVPQAVSGLTSRAASVLGRSDIGTIASGAQADLLVLEGDLASDPAALGRVVAVFKRGGRVPR